MMILDTSHNRHFANKHKNFTLKPESEELYVRSKYTRNIINHCVFN